MGSRVAIRSWLMPREKPPPSGQPFNLRESPGSTAFVGGTINNSHHRIAERTRRQEEFMRQRVMQATKSDSASPAMALWLTIEEQERQVVDLDRQML